jgi:hypothetical protein
MPGAWVREPCLHRWYLGGASQPNRPRQAVAGSERGQSQPPRRAVRSTHEPVFWRHCHCRGTESRRWLTWPLRTQVCASLFSRSSALGPMLLPSARVLLPFFVRSARPARRRSRLAVEHATPSLRDHLRVHNIYTVIYTYFRRASLASCRRLAQWYESLFRWPVSRDRIPLAPIGYCIFRSVHRYSSTVHRSTLMMGL